MNDTLNYIVTGAGGGLGSAIVRRMLQDRNVRLFCVDKNRLALESLPRTPRVRRIVSDISTISECERIMELGNRNFNGLIHLAGTLSKDLKINENESHWDDIVNSNLKSAYRLTGELLENLSEAGPVNILYFSGIAYRRGAYENVAYSIAKAGIVGLTRSIAKRVGSRGVVNALCPGVIMTIPPDEVGVEGNISINMNEYLSRHGDRIIRQIPMMRFGRPEEVAEATAFFMSPKCSYITGQVINIDGGIINS